jgi:hypothetical protein
MVVGHSVQFRLAMGCNAGLHAAVVLRTARGGKHGESMGGLRVAAVVNLGWARAALLCLVVRAVLRSRVDNLPADARHTAADFPISLPNLFYTIRVSLYGRLKWLAASLR